MSWGAILGLLTGLWWACFAVSIQKAANPRVPLMASLFYTTVVGVVVLPLTAAFYWTLVGVPLINWWGVLFFALSGGITVVSGRLAFIKSVGFIGPVRANQLRQTEPIFTILLAWMLLGELLNWWQYLGAAIALWGMYLLIQEMAELAGHRGQGPGVGPVADNERRAGWRWGVFLALLCGLEFGTGTILRKIALNYWPTSVGGVMVTALASFAVIQVMLLQRKMYPALIRSWREERASVRHLLWAGFYAVVAWFSLYGALALAPASLVTVLGSTSPLFMLPLSYYFLREQDKITGTVLLTTAVVTAGVVMVMW